jgi:class 3 adenylate cyclase
LSASLGRLLEAHIGIASSEVVAGTLGRGESQDYMVLGDSVNLAARLVAEAGPGQTLIADIVYRALSGRSVSDALGEMQLKGVTARVRVWSLRGISGEPRPANRRGFRPFVTNMNSNLPVYNCTT